VGGMPSLRLLPKGENGQRAHLYKGRERVGKGLKVKESNKFFTKNVYLNQMSCDPRRGWESVFEQGGGEKAAKKHI